MPRGEYVPSGPWRNLKVSFELPRSAARRLRDLAIAGDRRLREIGILKVQIRELHDISVGNNAKNITGWTSKNRRWIENDEYCYDRAAVTNNNSITNQAHLEKYDQTSQLKPTDRYPISDHHSYKPPPTARGLNRARNEKKHSSPVERTRNDCQTKIIGISRGTETDDNEPVDKLLFEPVPEWVVENSICISFRRNGRYDVACQTGFGRNIVKTKATHSSNASFSSNESGYKIFNDFVNIQNTVGYGYGRTHNERPAGSTQCSSESIRILESLANSLVIADEEAQAKSEGRKSVSVSSNDSWRLEDDARTKTASSNTSWLDAAENHQAGILEADRKLELENHSHSFSPQTFAAQNQSMLALSQSYSGSTAVGSDGKAVFNEPRQADSLTDARSSNKSRSDNFVNVQQGQQLSCKPVTRDNNESPHHGYAPMELSFTEKLRQLVQKRNNDTVERESASPRTKNNTPKPRATNALRATEEKEVTDRTLDKAVDCKPSVNDERGIDSLSLSLDHENKQGNDDGVNQGPANVLCQTSTTEPSTQDLRTLLNKKDMNEQLPEHSSSIHQQSHEEVVSSHSVEPFICGLMSSLPPGVIVKRKRGRPPKSSYGNAARISVHKVAKTRVAAVHKPELPRRKRGRPPKIKPMPEVETVEEQMEKSSNIDLLLSGKLIPKGSPPGICNVDRHQRSTQTKPIAKEDVEKHSSSCSARPMERPSQMNVDKKYRSRLPRRYLMDSVYRDIKDCYDRMFVSVACQTAEVVPEDVYYGENYPVIFADDDSVAMKFVDMSLAFKLAMRDVTVRKAKPAGLVAPIVQNNDQDVVHHYLHEHNNNELTSKMQIRMQEDDLCNNNLEGKSHRRPDGKRLKLSIKQSKQRAKQQVAFPDESQGQPMNQEGKPSHIMSLRPRKCLNLGEEYSSSDSYEDEIESLYESDDSSDSEPLKFKLKARRNPHSGSAARRDTHLLQYGALDKKAVINDEIPTAKPADPSTGQSTTEVVGRNQYEVIDQKPLTDKSTVSNITKDDVNEVLLQSPTTDGKCEGVDNEIIRKLDSCFDKENEKLYSPYEEQEGPLSLNEVNLTKEKTKTMENNKTETTNTKYLYEQPVDRFQTGLPVVAAGNDLYDQDKVDNATAGPGASGDVASLNYGADMEDANQWLNSREPDSVSVIVHREIKPGNAENTSDNEKQLAKSDICLPLLSKADCEEREAILEGSKKSSCSSKDVQLSDDSNIERSRNLMKSPPVPTKVEGVKEVVKIKRDFAKRQRLINSSKSNPKFPNDQIEKNAGVDPNSGGSDATDNEQLGDCTFQTIGKSVIKDARRERVHSDSRSYSMADIPDVKQESTNPSLESADMQTTKFIMAEEFSSIIAKDDNEGVSTESANTKASIVKLEGENITPVNGDSEIKSTKSQNSPTSNCESISTTVENIPSVQAKDKTRNNNEGISNDAIKSHIGNDTRDDVPLLNAENDTRFISESSEGSITALDIASGCEDSSKPSKHAGSRISSLIRKSISVISKTFRKSKNVSTDSSMENRALVVKSNDNQDTKSHEPDPNAVDAFSLLSDISQQPSDVETVSSGLKEPIKYDHCEHKHQDAEGVSEEQIEYHEFPERGSVVNASSYGRRIEEHDRRCLEADKAPSVSEIAREKLHLGLDQRTEGNIVKDQSLSHFVGEENASIENQICENKPTKSERESSLLVGNIHTEDRMLVGDKVPYFPDISCPISENSGTESTLETVEQALRTGEAQIERKSFDSKPVCSDNSSCSNAQLKDAPDITEIDAAKCLLGLFTSDSNTPSKDPLAETQVTSREAKKAKLEANILIEGSVSDSLGNEYQTRSCTNEHSGSEDASKLSSVNISEEKDKASISDTETLLLHDEDIEKSTKLVAKSYLDNSMKGVESIVSGPSSHAGAIDAPSVINAIVDVTIKQKNQKAENENPKNEDISLNSVQTSEKTSESSSQNLTSNNLRQEGVDSVATNDVCPGDKDTTKDNRELGVIYYTAIEKPGITGNVTASTDGGKDSGQVPMDKQLDCQVGDLAKQSNEISKSQTNMPEQEETKNKSVQQNNLDSFSKSMSTAKDVLKFTVVSVFKDESSENSVNAANNDDMQEGMKSKLDLVKNPKSNDAGKVALKRKALNDTPDCSIESYNMVHKRQKIYSELDTLSDCLTNVAIDEEEITKIDTEGGHGQEGSSENFSVTEKEKIDGINEMRSERSKEVEEVGKDDCKEEDNERRKVLKVDDKRQEEDCEGKQGTEEEKTIQEENAKEMILDGDVDVAGSEQDAERKISNKALDAEGEQEEEEGFAEEDTWKEYEIDEEVLLETARGPEAVQMDNLKNTELEEASKEEDKTKLCEEIIIGEEQEAKTDNAPCVEKDSNGRSNSENEQERYQSIITSSSVKSTEGCEDDTLQYEDDCFEKTDFESSKTLRNEAEIRRKNEARKRKSEAETGEDKPAVLTRSMRRHSGSPAKRLRSSRS